MTLSRIASHLFFVCLTWSMALGLVLNPALLNPVAAIQNIGFPDQQRLTISKADLKPFQAAQQAMHDALEVMAKFGGIKGDSVDRAAALKTIRSNA